MLETEEEELVQMDPMSAETSSSDRGLFEEPVQGTSTSDIGNLVDFGNTREEDEQQQDTAAATADVEAATKEAPSKARSHLEEEFSVWRRVIFFMFLLLLLIAVPACVF